MTECDLELDKTDHDTDYCSLYSAAYFDDIDRWTVLVQRQHDLVTLKSKHGNTFLHIAASQNSLRILNVLIDLFPLHIDGINNWSETPLHLAVAAGYKDAVNALVAAGSSLSAQDMWGRTPLMVSEVVSE